MAFRAVGLSDLGGLIWPLWVALCIVSRHSAQVVEAVAVVVVVEEEEVVVVVVRRKRRGGAAEVVVLSHVRRVSLTTARGILPSALTTNGPGFTPKPLLGFLDLKPQTQSRSA